MENRRARGGSQKRFSCSTYSLKLPHSLERKTTLSTTQQSGRDSLYSSTLTTTIVSLKCNSGSLLTKHVHIGIDASLNCLWNVLLLYFLCISSRHNHLKRSKQIKYAASLAPNLQQRKYKTNLSWSRQSFSRRPTGFCGSHVSRGIMQSLQAGQVGIQAQREVLSRW